MDTTKLALELHSVASDVARNRLQARSKTFKLCGTGATNRIAGSDKFTYHTFRLCPSEGGLGAWNGACSHPGDGCNRIARSDRRQKLRQW